MDHQVRLVPETVASNKIECGGKCNNSSRVKLVMAYNYCNVLNKRKVRYINGSLSETAALLHAWLSVPTGIVQVRHKCTAVSNDVSFELVPSR